MKYKGIKIIPQPMSTYNELGEKIFNVKGKIIDLENKEYIFNIYMDCSKTEAKACEAFRKIAEKHIDDNL